MGLGYFVFLNSSHIFIAHSRYFGSQPLDIQIPYLSDPCPHSTDAKEVLYDPARKDLSEDLTDSSPWSGGLTHCWTAPRALERQRTWPF